MEIGIFVGSFDPFTIGHDVVVRRSLSFFDKVVIGVGINERKKCMLSAEERTERIARLYADEAEIEVKVYCDLTIDSIRRKGAEYIIKGIRSIKDFEYERKQADVNRCLSSIEAIFFYAEPQFESVNSNVVRELRNFGRDITEFLPKEY